MKCQKLTWMQIMHHLLLILLIATQIQILIQQLLTHQPHKQMAQVQRHHLQIVKLLLQ